MFLLKYIYLLNINRYHSFFWDGRAQNLYTQIDGPLFTINEMRSNNKIIRSYVLENPAVKTVYLGFLQKKLVLNEVDFIKKALIAYITSITTKKTKYDLYTDGKIPFSKAEMSGKNLFFGKAKCSACHTTPNFTDNAYHDNGLFKRKLIVESRIINGKEFIQMGTDKGRGDIIGGIDNLYRFRTPSLINIELTEPYMHDGSLPTLEAVIDFYARGGDLHPKRPILRLTMQEKNDLVAFLKTLTDIRHVKSN